MNKSIALLEVQGYITAVEGLDVMLKTADVEFIHIQKKLGGRMVTVVISGDVSAVKAAAEAGRAAASKVGKVKLCEVIARPHDEIMKFLI